jgi:hypothetical protein
VEGALNKSRHPRHRSVTTRSFTPVSAKQDYHLRANRIAAFPARNREGGDKDVLIARERDTIAVRYILH